MPAFRPKRSVADIFDDLDNIGKVMPAFSESPIPGLEGDDDDDGDKSGRREDPSSVPKKRSRLESEDGVVSASKSGIATAAASKHLHLSASALGSKRGSCSPLPSITIGGPFSPDMDREDSSSSSSAFASELTTRHRKAEEQADTAMFLAESLHQSPTSEALTQLVDHFDACGSIPLLRTIRTTGALPSFLRAVLSDSKYASIRSANYALQYLRFLGHLTNLLPHDLLPVDAFFSRLVWFVGRAVSVLPRRQESDGDSKPLTSPQILPHTALGASMALATGQRGKKVSGGLAAAVASRVAKNPLLRLPAPCATETVAKSGGLRSTAGEHDLSASVDHLLARDMSSGSNTASVPSDFSSDSAAFLDAGVLPSSAAPMDDEQAGRLAVAHAAIDAATRLLLEHNTHQLGREGSVVNGLPGMPTLSNLLSKSAAVLFAEIGGLNAVRCLLREVRVSRRLPLTHPLALSSCKLVTLVTCDAELAKLMRRNAAVSASANTSSAMSDHGRVTQQLLGECSEWIREFQEAPSCSAESTTNGLPLRDAQLEVTRALINMTSILPYEQDPYAASTLDSLVRWIRRNVEELDTVARDKATASLDIEPDGTTGDVMEAGTLCICLAINLVRRGECVDAVAALTHLGPGQEEEVLGSSFLAQCARLLVRWHEATDSQRSVVAGYSSMLLGCISLCCSLHCDYRIAVITAIARDIGRSGTTRASEPSSSALGMRSTTSDSQSTSIKDVQVKRKPMSLVVAVLQEFILFQSSAGILSRDVLVEMHQAVERIIASNEIDVGAASTAAEAEFNGL